MDIGQENYEFKGLKLTPAVFSKLIVLLFDGKQFSRQTAIDMVSDYHSSHGGIIEEGRNLIAVFKAATKNMQKNDVGLINKGYGIWELHYEVHTTIKVVDKAATLNLNTYKVDETFGTGSNAVYVYYYDVYKELAEIKGKKCWECKIGRTDRDPIQRVVSQAGTCYPELPHIALVIYCDDSAALEAALHSILKFQNKWIKEAPGTEWFLTSPQEVRELYFILSQ